MRFSVVTPVRNGMPWLPGAVESVRAQRQPGVTVEYIIRDGGSQDGTAAWLSQHAADCTVVSQPDAGQTDALMHGFAHATGDILGWLNADDLLEPGALARVAAAFEANPHAVMVTGGCLLIRADGSICGAVPSLREVNVHTLVNSTVKLAQPATFFRRHAYQQIGGLGSQWSLAMDLDLFLRLLSVGPCVTLSQEVLARFRLHPDARSQVQRHQTAREELAIKRAFGLRRLSGVHRMIVQEIWLPPRVAHAANALYEVVRKPQGDPEPRPNQRRR